MKSSPTPIKLHVVFNYFLSDDIKQDAAHRKKIIELIKQQKIMSAKLRTPWENTDGFSEHYTCVTGLFLFSMLSQAFYLMNDHVVSEPGHVREYFSGLNTIDLTPYLR